MIGDEVGIDLADNQKKIVEYLLANRTISARELSNKLGKSKRQTEANISLISFTIIC